MYGGDDQDAKAVAATLIRDVGFDPADAGRLRIARYLEAFALAMAQLAYEGDNGPEIAYRIERSSLAPNRSRMDTIDSNQQFMRRFVEFINTADSTMARDLVSPNAIFHVPGRPDPLTGPEGYLAIIAMMRGGVPDIQWTLEEMVVEPTKVAARFTMRGLHQGAFMGVPPTGRTIAVQALNIYHLSNGQIVREYGQPDMMGVMQQIGALPQ